MKRTIALLTDFGLGDNFVGIMKGVILNINPDAHLVDITHSLDPQNIVQGALTLKSAYSFFPPNTVFLVVVDPGVGSKRKTIIVKTKQYTFLAPDNGLLYPTLQEQKPSAIYTITNEKYFLKPVSNTFHGRDIFAPVAAYLAKGVSPKTFGKLQKAIVRLSIPQARMDKKVKCVKGAVIDIDRFGNLITNIEAKHLSVFKKLFIKINNKTINRLSGSYADVRKGELLAVMGSKGYLEISVHGGSASQTLKADIGQKIDVVCAE